MNPAGVALVVAAAVIWGTTGTTQALAPGAATPLAIAGVRVVFGGAALVAIALAGRSFSRRPPLGLAIVLSACVAFHQLAFFAAVERTGVAAGTIVTIGWAPAAAGLLAFAIYRERPGRRWYPATALAVAGCTLLALSGGEVAVDPLGIALAIAAGSGYAVYTVVAKSLVATRPPGEVVALAFGGAALLLLPVLASQDLGWLTEPRGAAAGSWLALGTVAIGYTLFGRGLMLVPSGSAVTLTLAEPVTAALLGVLLLSERLTAPAWAGALLVLLGLAYLALGTRSAPEIEAAPETPPPAG
ncbi:MAG TPA: EamA family transporter [Actinomycetota bacterium]|nr:EamA family transporter [Actinomycetota bacterium]